MMTSGEDSTHHVHNATLLFAQHEHSLWSNWVNRAIVPMQTSESSAEAHLTYTLHSLSCHPPSLYFKPARPARPPLETVSVPLSPIKPSECACLT